MPFCPPFRATAVSGTSLYLTELGSSLGFVGWVRSVPLCEELIVCEGEKKMDGISHHLKTKKQGRNDHKHKSTVGEPLSHPFELRLKGLARLSPWKERRGPSETSAA